MPRKWRKNAVFIEPSDFLTLLYNAWQHASKITSIQNERLRGVAHGEGTKLRGPRHWFERSQALCPQEHQERPAASSVRLHAVASGDDRRRCTDELDGRGGRHLRAFGTE